MPVPEGKGEKHKILALLWHAPHAVITAGGFRRTYEVFDRVPGNLEICALDDNPSLLRSLDRNNVLVIEYKIPLIVRRLEERYFWSERALEWTLSTVLMTVLCARLRATGERFNVVLVPSSEQAPALLAGIVAKLLFRAKLVVCSTNLDIFPTAVRKPLARLHNRADTVIVISEHLKKEFEAYGVRARLVVNGVGLDTKAIAVVAEPSVKEYDAVFVGRHDREKGVFDLIEIWSAVTKELPAARMLMIGSCNPRNRAKLASMISDYGLDENVVLMGIVDEDEKFSLMKRSKVCLFPSYVEEWGLVPQEALACGLPVVVYDLPVYEENIKRCEAVFHAPTGDIPGMAKMTGELLSNEEYRNYERTGPEFVRGFSWDEVAKREFQILSGQIAPIIDRQGRRVLDERAVKRMVDAPPAGARDTFKRLAVSYCKLFKSRKTFGFRGCDHHYFYHPYNLSWRNERTVEIPIAREFLKAHTGQEILEVGNVLSHYLFVKHDILDKHEVASGVINDDALDFAPRKKYDLIISISTLEHIGYDEAPKDPGRVLPAIANLAGLLAPGGEMVATVPLGYNPEFDRLLEQKKIPFSDVFALRRVPGRNEWVETDFESVRGSGYARNRFRADAIVVGVIREGQVESTSDRNPSS